MVIARFRLILVLVNEGLVVIRRLGGFIKVEETVSRRLFSFVVSFTGCWRGTVFGWRSRRRLIKGGGNGRICRWDVLG